MNRCVCPLFLALALAATGAPAQQYPTKPIRIIVPVTAGGPTDTIARIIGQKLTVRSCASCTRRV